jgi:hypothetical protein
VTARLPIEDALDDFFAAIAEQGKPLPEEPISAEDLVTVAEAVAPLLFPPGLVATWQRFQSGDSTVLTWMPMLPALHGLELWRQDFPASVLFPLAYESQEFLLVELTTSTTPGGALFRWGYDGGPAQPVFPDLETAFACAAEGWRRGVLSTWESPTQDAWTRLRATYSQAANYPEHLAPFEEIDLARPLSWPRVWQEASGIDAEAAEPRGSTTRSERSVMGKPGAGRLSAGSQAFLEQQPEHAPSSTTALASAWCGVPPRPIRSEPSSPANTSSWTSCSRQGRRSDRAQSSTHWRPASAPAPWPAISQPPRRMRRSWDRFSTRRRQTPSRRQRVRSVKQHGGGRRSCETDTTRRSQGEARRPIRDSNPCRRRERAVS